MNAGNDPRRATGWIRPVCIALLGLGLATGASAEVWTGTASIEFDAVSTLHDFTGTAPAEPFRCSIVREEGFVTLGGTALVAVAKMDTRHAKRDANLRAMFEAGSHPFISGAAASIRFEDGIPPASIPLQIAIRDRARTVPAALSDWRQEDGEIRFELTLTISLQAFELEPPVLLGLIRVGDAVAVRARVRLTRPAGSAKP